MDARIAPHRLDLTCPNCGSQDTKSLSIIYGTQTNHKKSVAIGGAYGTYNSLAAVGTVGTTQQSQLAKDLTPPSKAHNPHTKAWIIKAVVISIACTIPFSLTAAYAKSTNNKVLEAICAFISLAIIVSVSLYCRSKVKDKSIAWESENEQLYTKQLTEWKQSFLCQRCAAIFIPGHGP